MFDDLEAALKVLYLMALVGVVAGAAWLIVGLAWVFRHVSVVVS